MNVSNYNKTFNLEFNGKEKIREYVFSTSSIVSFGRKLFIVT